MLETMGTTKLLIVSGKLTPDNWMSFEDVLTRELDQLQNEIINLKEHLREILAGNFFIQGNALTSISYNIETNVIVNETIGSLSHALHSLNTSICKCYLVYGGLTHYQTGDWMLIDGSISYNQLSSIILSSHIPLQVNGAFGQELWLQNDHTALIKYRNSESILDDEYKELVHQISFKYLLGLSVCNEQNCVNISLKSNAQIFTVNNFNVCITRSELHFNENYQVYIALGNTFLPTDLSNLPCVLSKEASKIKKEADYAIRFASLNRLYDIPKEITTLYSQFDVGSLNMQNFCGEDCNVVGIVWTSYMKMVKVVRLIYAEGRDFTKFIEGLKYLQKSKVFHSIAGFCNEDKPQKECATSVFKVPTHPIKVTKPIAPIEASRSKALPTSSSKFHTTKLDSSFNKPHAEARSKDIKETQMSIKKSKVEIKSDTKPIGVGSQKDKDLVKEKNEINKTKSLATSNHHTVKVEKLALSKDKSLIDKNIRSNHNTHNKVDAVGANKKIGKVDLNFTTKETHNQSKLAKDKDTIIKCYDNKRKDKLPEVEISQINNLKSNKVIEESEILNNGGVVEHAVEENCGIKSSLNPLDKTGSQDVVSLTSPESECLIDNHKSDVKDLLNEDCGVVENHKEGVLVNNDIEDKKIHNDSRGGLIKDDMQEKKMNGGGNCSDSRGDNIKDDNQEKKINGEENCSDMIHVDCKGDHIGDNMQEKKVKAVENCNDGSGDYFNDMQEKKINGDGSCINGAGDHIGYNLEDNIDGKESQVNGEEGDHHLVNGGGNLITESELDTLNKKVNDIELVQASNEFANNSQDILDVHQANGSLEKNAGKEAVIVAVGDVNLNISNNATSERLKAIDQPTTSNIKSVNMDDWDLPIEGEIDENEAPGSPSYDMFVRDLEKSMLATNEPVEDFMDDIEPATQSEVVVDAVLAADTFDDLNKVHDLSSVSIDGDTRQEEIIKVEVVKDKLPEVVAKLPVHNGSSKTNKVIKTEKTTGKKIVKAVNNGDALGVISPERKLKKKKVPTATLR